MHISMPENGTSKETIFNAFQTFKKQDADWRNGKTFSLVFYPGEEITELIQQAYLQYFFENGLNFWDSIV